MVLSSGHNRLSPTPSNPNVSHCIATSSEYFKWYSMMLADNIELFVSQTYRFLPIFDHTHPGPGRGKNAVDMQSTWGVACQAGKRGIL